MNSNLLLPPNQDFIAIHVRDPHRFSDAPIKNCDFEWSSRSQHIHVFAWDINQGSKKVKQKSDVLVCGTPVSTVQNKSAADLIKERRYADLAGPYAVLTFPSGMNSIEIISDPFAIQPLFWFQCDEYTICGTRADNVAILSNFLGRLKLRLNTKCIRTMLILGQAEGNLSAFQNVVVTPYGSKIVFTPMEAKHERYWPVHWRQPKHKPKEVVQDLHMEIESRINALKNLVRTVSSPLEIDLTGGKDSRAILAMCAKAGILDDVEFVTQGLREFPDVIIGSNIADALNLNYRVTLWSPPLNSWETELRIRTLEGFGRKGSFDSASPRPGNTWKVQGFFGENWRTCFPNRKEPKSPEIALKFHEMQFYFRKQFLRAKDFDEAVKKSKNRLLGRLTNGEKPENITDIHYLEQHAKVFFSARVRSFDRIFMPLYSQKAQQIAFSTGLDARRSGWQISEIFKYCEFDLNIPFTKKLEGDSNLKLEAVEKYLRNKPKSLTSQLDYWADLKLRGIAKAPSIDRQEYLSDCLLKEPNHKIFELVDFRKIESVLKRPIGFNLKVARFLSDVVSAKIWHEQFESNCNAKRKQLGIPL